MSVKKGTLVIVGGHEEKEQGKERTILNEIAEVARRSDGTMVIVTVATDFPEEMAEEYTNVFRSLGVKNIAVLDIRTRDDAYSSESLSSLDNASVIFFTGGDQLRITSQLGGTPVFTRMLQFQESGGTIAGTSAGAAAIPECMIFGSPSEESQVISTMGMAPGLGLLKGIVIDSHFAQRGRFGRLIGAVAQNPENLGIGIDENTAIIVDNQRAFRVVGTGAVFVFDGRRISYSSLSDQNPGGILSIFNVMVHVLGSGDRFDLAERFPAPPDA